MNGYEYALEDDERFESDESDEALESDESDELTMRRRFGRRPLRIIPGRTGTGTGLFQPRPTGNKYATQAQLQVGLARVGKQIQANSEAIKKVTAQANTITSQLGAATSRLDKQVGDLKKDVKKQAETNMLMMLLQKPPAIKVETQKITVTDPADSTKTKDIELVSKIEQEKPSHLLPLLLMSGSGGFGGDGSNMLILALALSGQI